MFSFFKKKSGQNLGNASSNLNTTGNSSDLSNSSAVEPSTSQDQILHDYTTKRFSPLDIDLSKLDLSGQSNASKDPYNIIKYTLKHSKIPIYTGNPFNPYF